MPNPPRRNAQGCPGLIYRIDFREPSEVFEQGFQPWGNNRNFFQHILGYSLGDEIPEERRTGIISASDSPDSSLRFFGGMLNEPEDPLEYYLYEIRADENVYSAERTASFYHQRISTGQIDFSEGDLETAIDAVDAIFREFAYQREWFNVGPIPRERIRSAWRVDSVSILPNHIRHQRNTVYYTPRINEPEILNEHYVDEDTYANNAPYTEGATLITPSTVSVPSQLVESDATGGVSASLGFACSLTPDSPHRSPRSDNDSQKLKCYFDTKKVTHDLKGQKYPKPVILSDVFSSQLFLRGSKTKSEFLLTSSVDAKSNNVATLADLEDLHNVPLFIYDCFQCISWSVDIIDFSYALTPIKMGDIQTHYDLQYTVATTNNQRQKWRLEPVLITLDECLFRIRNIDLHDFCIKRDLKTSKLWVRPIDEQDDQYYEELYVVVAENKCDTCILLPQNSKTKLVDISLSWVYDGLNYVPRPEDNTSIERGPQKNIFFYDLKTYKIIYISNNVYKKTSIYALYNNRDNRYYRWDWVKWVASDLKPASNSRYKWYFQNDNFKTKDKLNFRNIRSYYKNDYLRVVTQGMSWGSLYTTWYESDIRSIAIFRIDQFADV